MGYNASGTMALTGTQNFLERLKTLLGYDGPALLQRESRIRNLHATNPLYLHFTNSNQYPPGVKQIDSVTVAGNITTSGNAVATITVLSATYATINFAVAVGMSNAQLAQALIAALSADVRLNAAYGGLFDYAINANVVSQARRDPSGGNDGSITIALTNGTSVGLTPATSTNIQLGQSPAAVGASGYKVLVNDPSDVFMLPAGTDLSTLWTFNVGINVNVAIQN